MHEVEYRSANAKDIHKFARRMHDAMFELMERDEFDGHDPLVILDDNYDLDRMTTGFVAESDGIVIGAIAVAKNGAHVTSKPYLIGIFVDPNHRRKGVAATLLKCALEAVHEHGISEVVYVAASQEMKELAKKTNAGSKDAHLTMIRDNSV